MHTYEERTARTSRRQLRTFDRVQSFDAGLLAGQTMIPDQLDPGKHGDAASTARADITAPATGRPLPQP